MRAQGGGLALRWRGACAQMGCPCRREDLWPHAGVCELQRIIFAPRGWPGSNTLSRTMGRTAADTPPCSGAAGRFDPGLILVKKRQTKTTATPPEQEQQECRSCPSVGDAQLSSRFSAVVVSSRPPPIKHLDVGHPIETASEAAARNGI